MTKRAVIISILACSGLSAIDCSHPTDNTGGVVGAGGINSNGGTNSNGGNASTCTSGTDCTGVCVDLKTNSAYCGSCTTKCATGQTCEASACKCQTGSDLCGTASCISLQTDATHCGTCTNACGSGQTCTAGACACGTSGQVACSGTCTDTQTDEANCGTCGTKCSTGQTCTAGQCTCQTGLTSCSGACVNVQSDAAHCGTCTTTCSGTTPVCSQGACKGTCATGETNCNGSCVNTTTNAQFCGSCTNACAAGQTCANSACTCSGAGEQACSGTCVNTGTDSNNCGTCGTKCTAGKTCVSGTCSCPTGQTDCNGACVDMKTSAANCGACANACLTGQACANGVCGCSDSTQTYCGGTCAVFNFSTDVNNCGTCGNKCATGATCTAGTCTGGGVTCSDATYTTYSQPYSGSFNSAAATQISSMASSNFNEVIAQMQGIDWGTTANKNWNDIFRSANTSSVYGFQFRDGPRGVNLDAPVPSAASAPGTTMVSTMVSGGKSTVFPVAMARGASFDLDLEYKIGQAIGDEMIAARQTMMLAPTVNILRHPFWGRAQETYGEDVFQLGRLGTAFTIGVQEYVPACAKHYAANNIENGREKLTVTMDERTLREDFARHFEMIIKDGGVACIMAAYNTIQVNGGTAKKCTQNAHLLTDILRTDFGFKGFVLSDWWAMPGSSGADPTATDQLRGPAAEAVAAGMDMELPWNMYFSQLTAIRDAASSPTISTAQIRTSATRILEQKLRFKVDKATGTVGLKTASTGFSGGTITGNGPLNPADNTVTHLDLAYQAALEGAVLLKNNNKTLPIASTATKVAVIGSSLTCSLTQTSSTTATNCNVNFGTDIRTGDIGSSRVNPTTGAVGPFDGIKNAAPTGVTVTNSTLASAAAGQDLVIVVAGLTARDEGEEYTGAGDRTTCALDGKQNSGVQNKLITDTVIAAAGKPVVVILEGGSVIDMPWLSQVQAVIMGWYPGMVGGQAFGDLVWGKKNFSGKLPLTWPFNCSTDEPTFSGGTTTAQGYDLGYRYFDRNKIAPQFFFGHGLSYTTFEYSNAQTNCSGATKTGVITLNVSVKNAGTVDGDEVVFAFASFPGDTTGRPIKELKGFTRARIPAGQSQQVSIQVRASDLKHWNTTTNSWVVDTGNVDFLVGPSADGSKLLKVTVPIQ